MSNLTYMYAAANGAYIPRIYCRMRHQTEHTTDTDTLIDEAATRPRQDG